MLSYFSNKTGKAKKDPEDDVEKTKSATAKDDTIKSRRSSRISSPPSKSSRKSRPQSRGRPVIDREDEKFLERLTSNRPPSSDSDDDGPPLPPRLPRVQTPEITLDSDTSSFESRQRKTSKGKGVKVAEPSEEEMDRKPKRFSFVANLSRNMSLRKKPETALQPVSTAKVSKDEADREASDVSQVLDNLDMAAENNRVFSLSRESGEMVQRFTQVFKDLVNGVPTAYDDLIKLIEDRDGAINRGYEKLPSGLKKLVAQLPDQLTSKLAPELLAVAAEAQGLTAEESAAAASGGMAGAAKSFLSPKNMRDLVTKPGAIVGMLKGIVNALKTRWPAFMGTNVLWSVALFILLSMLWYCYKRGRETRLEREAAEAEGPPIDGSSRIEELPDDPQLPAPSSVSPSSKQHRSSRPPSSRRNSDRSSGEYRRRRRHSGYDGYSDDYYDSRRDDKRRGSYHHGSSNSSSAASSSDRRRRSRREEEERSSRDKSSRDKDRDEDEERRRRRAARREEERLREKDEEYYERRRRSRRVEEEDEEEEEEREKKSSKDKKYDDDYDRRSRRQREEDRKRRQSSKAGGSSSGKKR